MPALNQKIAHFYDRSSTIWEETWGEHMHHGYYGADGTVAKDHYQAQIDLIEELLAFGNVGTPKRIVDLGCGIGGSALYLAEKYNAEVVGLTLSPFQARRATERAVAAGLSDRVRFEVADAQNPPLERGAYDLIWSMESGEHMSDKKKFLQVSADLLKPGGVFLMATWCHRPTPPALSRRDHKLLRNLYRDYHLPYIISLPDYAKIAEKVGLGAVESADWSQAVSPFWMAVVRSALSWQSVKGLLDAGLPTIIGAWAMNWMIRGYRRGLIRFGVLRGVKK